MQTRSSSRNTKAKFGLGFVLTIAIAVLGNEHAFGATQWPAWRGPGADGANASGDYPVEWAADTVTWKVALPGKGGSTPIVWNDVIYLTTPVAGDDSVMAVNFDGEVLWHTRLGTASPPKHRTLASSCNASPVTDGQGIFVYFRSGHFAALEFDGKVRWSQDLSEQFGPENLFWDQGSSPVVTDDHVILTRMHDGESWIAGFDKQTGEIDWKEPRNYDTPPENDNGYTTPILIERDGRKAALVWGADHLTVHDAGNGKVLWTCGGFNPEGTGYWPAISTPVVHGDLVVIPVGRDDRRGQGRMHGIRLGGQGDVTTTHRVWQRDDVGVFVPSLTVYDGRVYLMHNRGGLTCLDPSSGKTLWTESFPRGQSKFYSSPVVANGVLYTAREDGAVFVARVGERFEFLSENHMEERILASPVPINNRILLRGDQHLFCIATL